MDKRGWVNPLAVVLVLSGAGMTLTCPLGRGVREVALPSLVPALNLYVAAGFLAGQFALAWWFANWKMAGTVFLVALGTMFAAWLGAAARDDTHEYGMTVPRLLFAAGGGVSAVVLGIQLLRGRLEFRRADRELPEHQRPA